MVEIKGDYFRFGSVFIRKSNQTEIFFLKKKTETGSNDRFRFGFLGKNWFKPVWLGFFPGFFRFDSVPFFQFFTYKTETKPNWPVFLKF
jgi:hypothetical protein